MEKEAVGTTVLIATKLSDELKQALVIGIRELNAHAIILDRVGEHKEAKVYAELVTTAVSQKLQVVNLAPLITDQSEPYVHSFVNMIKSSKEALRELQQKEVSNNCRRKFIPKRRQSKYTSSKKGTAACKPR